MFNTESQEEECYALQVVNRRSGELDNGGCIVVYTSSLCWLWYDKCCKVRNAQGMCKSLTQNIGVGCLLGAGDFCAKKLDLPLMYR